jgi:hypothetical protein
MAKNVAFAALLGLGLVSSAAVVLAPVPAQAQWHRDWDDRYHRDWDDRYHGDWDDRYYRDWNDRFRFGVGIGAYGYPTYYPYYSGYYYSPYYAYAPYCSSYDYYYGYCSY